MNPNLSTQHQNELLRATFAKISECRDELETLDARLREQTLAIQQYRRTEHQDAHSIALKTRQQLETEFHQQAQVLSEAFQTETKLTKAELQDELGDTKKQIKQQHSDGEYDWFLSKQRLEKEVEADKEAAKEAFRTEKSNLRQYQQEFVGLTEEAKATLGRHGGELNVHGGDLLDPPDDSDHLAAHRRTFGQIQQLVTQFRRTFWVRYQEERWYLIAFLAGMLVLPFPIHLALDNLFLAGMIAAGVSLFAAVASWGVSRRFARHAASQFEEPFASAIATGKQQLLASQQQNKHSCERKIAKLEKHLVTQTTKLDEQWEQKRVELSEYLQKRQTELQSLASKRGSMVQQQWLAKENTLKQKYEPRIQELQVQLEEKKEQLAATEQQQLSELNVEVANRRVALQKGWQDYMAAAGDDVAQMLRIANTHRIDLTADFADWIPPTQPPLAVPLGNLTVPLTHRSNRLPEGEGFEIDADHWTLPAALDLLHAPSLLVESSMEKDGAAELLRLAMVRLLTSTPAGKLRFTIVDPVGLGQSFSSLMHLGDYDEELIQHRIWTEPSHIQTRLADLTHHMENIIQTYLRNEFTSIQDYNRQAGEVAEAFRVLVIANFPAGFTEEAAQRLLSVVSSGPRCGVFTLMSVDPTQEMPRNFDLEELRGQTNVLVLDGEAMKWGDSPLGGFAIDCDKLPNEEQVTHIMHHVGKHAKEAARVEVPFAAVAPAEGQWWTGDSRNEISVSLGRAGATKLQEMRLGKGTSQHVLISGKTGSGKSTLLHAFITNLSLKYSPAEVQFYLIDFKKGVEFKAYAEHGLPHARVIAIESEREFGQSVLQRLDGELRRRGDLFRRVGVQSVAGYRDARPDENMPRILLVIDEFQEFFVKEDKISQEASLLLDRLVRQGRAFGIHVLLGSQTLAGAYSLARATIGQMAVRVALQCSAADANLILSDDNDAARLLRRPGEAIYNDANGMVEGNHPFQVVWLTDLEKESYLRQLAVRSAEGEMRVDAPIVFEGNVAAEVGKNLQLSKAWSAPAPEEVPLAPRAWLGEAVAIKEAPAVVFHRRSGANVMLVGQQDETALGIMASSLLSLASFSPSDPQKQTRFIVLDGTRPESPMAGCWKNLQEVAGIDLSLMKPRDALTSLSDLHAEVMRRQENSIDDGVTTFLFIYNLSRFRDLQRTDDDFGFGGFDESKKASPAEMLAGVLRDGPSYGIHTVLWSESYSNLMRWVDRPSLRDIESRVLFQMSATDSSNLMDSSAASNLGPHRAMFYSEDRGRAERFRPYGVPQDEILLRIRAWQSEREQPGKQPSDNSG